MRRSELTEFEVEEEGFKIRIKRGQEGVPGYSQPPAPHLPVPANAPKAPSVSGETAAAASAGADEAGFAYVKSPMVGTFYRSPSPDNPPFVDTGSKVEEKTVVCIIEAMKIMNEIESEYDGVITEVLAQDAHPVEYGQVLFRIDPNG